MGEHKYTQMQAKNRREVTRDGNTYVQFRGVLRYPVPNPQYVEKPEGKDTRTAMQKRKTVYKEVSKTLEAEKVTTNKGRGAKERNEQQTEANISAELEKWRDMLEAEESKPDAAKRTVIDYAKAYIELRERVQVNGMKRLEASTALDYRKSLKRLEGGFSKMAMGDVTTKYVRDWERKQLEKGVSVYQVRKCHRLLHLLFENAYNEEEVDANPVARVTPPSMPKKEPNSLTQEGMQFVTAQLESMVPTPEVTAAYLGLHAGLRCAEACALKWSDIDFKQGTITVRGSIGVAKGGSYYKGTKTGKPRVVDFDAEQMAVMLKKRRDLMLEQRDNLITDFDGLYVCGNAAGGWGVPTVISRQWATLSNSWGLVGTSGERVNFHALRHSFVTAQLATGSSVRDVADNAGHSSTQMTVDTYASALRKGKKNAALKSGEYMRPKAEATIHKLAANQ